MNRKDAIRLQKIIADSGYCSRRKAEAYIERGLVKVNGRTATLGDKANPARDVITVDGKTMKRKDTPRYIKLYKPRGYVCTMSDPHAADGKLITDLLKKTDITQRVYPVGRLDANSEGLILLTNDGAFANRIAHPANEYSKVYRVTVSGKVTEAQLAQLSAGVEIEGDGKPYRTRPCIVDVATAEEKRTVLLFTIVEGKNRQVRRMCAAMGLNVTRLKRTSIGGVKLGMLAQGEYADLTHQELRLLGHEQNKC
ncbi:MAG: rRNA pseudouridine synthase [Oscillospiraceae bacterium]|nr:rRNA pseudouridine synthase [Oscillospiraceae bacterium]